MATGPDRTCPHCGRPLKTAGICNFCKSGDPYAVHPVYYGLAIVFAAIVVSMVGFRLFQTGQAISFSITRILGGGIYEVRLAAKNLPVSRTAPDTISLEEVLEIRRMLQEERYDDLNRTLDSYQKIFEGDHAQDNLVHDAYGAFDLTLAAYEWKLMDWVAHSPSRAPPHLALAVYYHALGWERRGTRYAAETPDSAMEAMGHYFALAQEHVGKALAINPDLMMAYKLLIDIANATGNDADQDRLIADALARFPESFQIGLAAIWANLPRWGGSYAAMEKIAKKLEGHAERNPCLTALYGYIYSDQAQYQRRKKNYDKAVNLLGKAMEYGDAYEFYWLRARIYHYHLEQRPAALADIEKCIELRPPIPGSYRMRSKIFFALGDYDEARAALETARAQGPGDPETEEWQQWAANNLLRRGHRAFKTDQQAAITYYGYAAQMDEEWFEPRYWRGVLYFKTKELDRARWDLERAIELNPEHFESVRLLDAVLAREGQWETIIDYWDAFLSEQPEHAGAYLERGGAYHHYGDKASAAADFETACRLGSQKACSLLDRFR